MYTYMHIAAWTVGEVPAETDRYISKSQLISSSCVSLQQHRQELTKSGSADDPSDPPASAESGPNDQALQEASIEPAAPLSSSDQKEQAR